ncbi:4Fe-4S binding protein [Spirochaeta isovalerica]|uniref:Ferredoxin n=1 Tax=Spirochaeta isovalerica TaxID=150 RepID=A0A841R5R3_9SPIO|nr:4Fe-4S binding protein [Spirochaeta isovalerica]MBB6480534.1 ferredoxin [Spirochaeta isovalerica]
MMRINGVFFSPTHTSEKILNGVIEGMGSDPSSMVNLTYEESFSDYKEEDIVLFALPVYSGRIPVTALNRLNNLRGKGTRAVVIAVYGNRAFDDALAELNDVVESLGFSVISAAAFIGEHSYSEENYPIAEGRPDHWDLEKARDYGVKLRDILAEGREAGKPDIPGNRPYRERSPENSVHPVTDKNLCTLCLDCVAVCPTGAIDKSSPALTEGDKCIKCCACIKICSVHARAFHDPGMKAITEKLFNHFRERREPEFFF